MNIPNNQDFATEVKFDRLKILWRVTIVLSLIAGWVVLNSAMLQRMDLVRPLLPVGLMTMAPWEAPPDDIRAVFRRTRALAAHLWAELALDAPPALSMGMTDDFEIAIEEGATIVRVGRALFGERERAT